MREFETRSDRVALWVSEKCTVHADAAGKLVGPEQGTKKSTLHEMFKAWAKDEDSSAPMSSRKFIERLRSVSGVGEVRLRNENKNVGLNVTPGSNPTPPESTPHLSVSPEDEGDGTDMGGAERVGSVVNGLFPPYVRESKINDHGQEGVQSQTHGGNRAIPTLVTPPTPEPTPEPVSQSVTEDLFDFYAD
jgi:phage/plasmid-associated DNA primase